MKLIPIFFLALLSFSASEKTITLYNGYLTKLSCEGKLLISAVGDQKLVALEALPNQVGCGVLIKPLVQSGRTNLALETTTGSVSVILEIAQPNQKVNSSQLDLKVRSLE